MTDIPGFWQDGPHDPIMVEATWRDFVRTMGGIVVDDVMPQPREIENADFAFLDASVIAELKEIETEFSSAPAFLRGFDMLMHKLVTEDPEWRPILFGGTGQHPAWFASEFIRLFRPPLSRILKKANRQLRLTKAHFGIDTPTGILLFVNDGFTSIGPDLIHALTSDLLLHSYSSIDCCIYLTVNRYVEIAGSDEPKLIWAPRYSNRASDRLVSFVDELGRNWYNFLEQKIGPFTSRAEVPQEADVLRGAKSIVLPSENDSNQQSSGTAQKRSAPHF